ncbi:type III restriction/modification enzyme restriction subunit [Flavobacterium aquaticum]|uniref:Type III restriction/modification enzyme restriction subunit n=1 Tax=Flavobacterium aquaticum TaxID=1236486 RepID=A0A327YSV8_9FLAO|nr:DEAD/DEAH box helicase [Flavobacterium aquaticum]RAK24178.1 type III restriction/modification enzyme restriction subunit [Flavobacterium aquaticum]
MSTIDFDLVNVPVEYKKINIEDFDSNYYNSTKEFISPNPETGYISEELMPILIRDLEVKNTTVINAGTGQGKSKCIIDIVSEYINKEDYIVVFALPYNNLIEQYYNECKRIVDERKIFSLLNLDKPEPNTKFVFGAVNDEDFINKSKTNNFKVHILTVYALLENPGEDALFQSNKRKRYFKSLIKYCETNNKKVVLIFDELHDSIHTFKQEYIFNLWRLKNIVHKNYVISATFNESSKEIIKYLSEFTEKNIHIVESERIIIAEKQGDLHLILHQENNDIVENENLKSLFRTLLHNNKRFDVIVYSKSQLKKMQKKTYFKDIDRSILNFCYNDIFNPNFIRKYNNSKINIGTNFSTGINITKENHTLVIILPPRTDIKYFNNKGVFTSGYVSILQAVARLRKKGDIYIVMSEPLEILENSLPSFIENKNGITEILQKYQTLGSVEYYDINSQKNDLVNAYVDYTFNIRKAKKNIEEVNRTGMNFLDYLRKEQFVLQKGETYLNSVFFNGDLSTYVFYIAITNQFTNCRLKSIDFNPDIYFDSESFVESIRQHYLTVVNSAYKNNLAQTNLMAYSGHQIFTIFNSFLNQRRVYLDNSLVETNKIKELKMYFLMNVLTLGEPINEERIRDYRKLIKSLYFKSCLSQVLNLISTGVTISFENEKLNFYYNQYKNWNELLQVVNEEIINQKGKSLLNTKASSLFIQKFNELDMFNKLNRLINEDVVINLDLFPLYDTFKRFNNSSQAGQYFYELLIEIFFKVNEKKSQKLINGKKVLHYRIEESFSQENFRKEFYVNMLFSNSEIIGNNLIN